MSFIVAFLYEPNSEMLLSVFGKLGVTVTY